VFLSKIFRKKSIVVAGGGDVAKVPEIKYGAMIHPINKFFAKFSFRYADFVLVVSNFTKMEVLKNTNADPARVVTVYPGFDPERIRSNGEKEDLVVSVSGVGWHTLKLKGLETFVKSAKYLPDVEFLLIGWQLDNSINHLRSISTKNVEFIGYLPFDRLLSYLRKAKVYVQVSYRESFGCALAEAMLCECVPVVTKRGALPKIVGDTGFYVPYGDPKRTALGIQEALASRNGKDARERIVKKFPQIKREQALKKIIGSLLNE
jgi:glycosyltransferase involved in cell wall biosynthesis